MKFDIELAFLVGPRSICLLLVVVYDRKFNDLGSQLSADNRRPNIAAGASGRDGTAVRPVLVELTAPSGVIRLSDGRCACCPEW